MSDSNRERNVERINAAEPLHPACPNCSGPLSYTHNKSLSFFSCNGRCKATFELHSAKDMVQFFKPTPASTARTDGWVSVEERLPGSVPK